MILVTGGTGILGSQLILDLLKESTPLRILYRKEKKKEKLKQFLINSGVNLQLWETLEFVKAEVNDLERLEESFKNITKVYHCANMVSFDEKKRKKLLKVNVEGTKNMVNLALEYRVEKFCFVSSIAAIDTPNVDGLYDETTFWDVDKNHGSYDTSKYLAEMEVWRASNEGLDVLIVNPGVIINSYDFSQSSGSIFNVYSGKKAYYTKGNISVVDVRDVSKRMIFLMNSDIINQKFILIAESVSLKLFANYIRKKLNLDYAHGVSNKIIRIAAKLQPILRYFINSMKEFSPYVAESITKKTIYSNQKINNVYPDPFITYEDSLDYHLTIYKKTI